MDKLIKLIVNNENLIEKTYFGGLELKVEAGHIVLIRKVESLKKENIK